MSKIEYEGEIAGHEVTFTVDGPEAQEMDGDRIGSDVLAVKINERIGQLKVQVES